MTRDHFASVDACSLPDGGGGQRDRDWHVKVLRPDSEQSPRGSL